MTTPTRRATALACTVLAAFTLTACGTSAPESKLDSATTTIDEAAIAYEEIVGNARDAASTVLTRPTWDAEDRGGRNPCVDTDAPDGYMQDVTTTWSTAGVPEAAWPALVNAVAAATAADGFTTPTSTLYSGDFLVTVLTGPHRSVLELANYGDRLYIQIYTGCYAS